MAASHGGWASLGAVYGSSANCRAVFRSQSRLNACPSARGMPAIVAARAREAGSIPQATNCSNRVSNSRRVMVLVATRRCRCWGENYSAAVGFAVVHTGHVVATNSANGVGFMSVGFSLVRNGRHGVIFILKSSPRFGQSCNRWRQAVENGPLPATWIWSRDCRSGSLARWNTRVSRLATRIIAP